MTGQRSPENAEGLPTKEELFARIKEAATEEAKSWKEFGRIFENVTGLTALFQKKPSDEALDRLIDVTRRLQAPSASLMKNARAEARQNLVILLDNYGMAGILDLLSTEFGVRREELDKEMTDGSRWVGEEPLSTVSLDGWLGTMVMRHSLHGKGEALDTYTSPTGEVRYFDWKKIRESYRKKQPGLSALFLKERLVEQKDHAVEKIGEQLRDIQTYPARGDTEGVYALYYASEYLSRRRLLQELSTRHSEVEGGS